MLLILILVNIIILNGVESVINVRNSSDDECNELIKLEIIKIILNSN
jgi:hypothetical protein